GLSHNVGHCTFIHTADIPRAAPIGATFELSPYLWSPSPITDDITSAIGDERIDRVWPFRDLVESDALTVAGSDWAVVPSVNPWIAVEALVTRRAPGGGDVSFGEGQAISVEDAIDLFTVNSAEHMGAAGRQGAIQAGALADFIVLDRNPYDIPATELHQTTVTRTVIGGETVFQADQS
ncbi:MAG: amidohydrolase family protein, partial [Caulobacterales bacterium]|nr:amidohydrolase family protein [Caulobacterales bacterium]